MNYDVLRIWTIFSLSVLIKRVLITILSLTAPNARGDRIFVRLQTLCPCPLSVIRICVRSCVRMSVFLSLSYRFSASPQLKRSDDYAIASETRGRRRLVTSCRGEDNSFEYVSNESFISALHIHTQEHAGTRGARKYARWE